MRHLHPLAIRVCDHLGLRRDRVAVHWACKKIAKACALGAAGEPGAPSDEELTRVREPKSEIRVRQGLRHSYDMYDNMQFRITAV